MWSGWGCFGDVCLDLECGTPGDKDRELRFKEQGSVPSTYLTIREGEE